MNNRSMKRKRMNCKTRVKDALATLSLWAAAVAIRLAEVRAWRA